MRTPAASPALVLATLLAVPFTGEGKTVICPPIGWNGANPKPYEHHETACDLAIENDPRRALGVMAALEKSVKSGAARQLKDQQTWICPADDGDGDGTESVGSGAARGPQSKWIVHNRAKTPVVVSWLAPTSAGNLEVSAVNNRIYPASNDPKAILQPGDWMKVDVYLGLVYHVRELSADAAPGRLLLRHRPGPIGIHNRFGPADINCPVIGHQPPSTAPGEPPKPQPPKGGLADPEPPKPPRKLKPTDPKPETKAPEFDHRKPCNAIPVAFYNHVPCPVDLYYAGVEVEGYKTRAADKFGNDIDIHSGSKHNACKEFFTFHLGVDPAFGTDYYEKWSSPVNYGYTYLSHHYVARLRHDKDVMVDEITIERTLVEDCPDGKKQRVLGAKTEAEGERAGERLVEDWMDEVVSSRVRNATAPSLESARKARNVTCSAATCSA